MRLIKPSITDFWIKENTLAIEMHVPKLDQHLQLDLDSFHMEGYVWDEEYLSKISLAPLKKGTKPLWFLMKDVSECD